MGESTSPLGDVSMSNIGAALAAASSPASNPSGGAGESDDAGAGNGNAHAKSTAPSVQSLDFILDIPLKVTVELGRSKMAIREILQLAQGSVVELSKFAGEPLEVLVNEKLIARGEVVVVNEKFGIRLTDIISPVERIEQLK
jgi:flagellar motor switch protein FliN/FliY